MNTNIRKYKNDYNKLVDLGNDLYNSIQYEYYPEEFKKAVKKVYKESIQKICRLRRLVFMEKQMLMAKLL